MDRFRLGFRHLVSRVWPAIMCAVFALGLLYASGCKRDSALPESPVEHLRAGARSANVIVIVLDAARPDHFGFLGYERDTTPNADELFAESIVFDNAYCQAPNTKASVASLFTSQYPSTHGVVGLHRTLPRGTATLAEVLKGRGLRTVCFSANPFLSSEFGFDRGFDEFHEIFRQAGFSANTLSGRVPAELLGSAATEWFTKHKKKRFFAYLHFLEPHRPYAPPEPFLSKYHSQSESDSTEGMIALYDGNLAYADHVVGQLLTELRGLGLLDTSVVIFMADHGEAFGEHGRLGHNDTVYDETIHIPLAIRLPPACGAEPAVRSEIISVTDLLPTILDLLEVPVPRTAQGTSRLPLLAGESEAEPAMAVSRSRGRDGSGGRRRPRQVIYAVTGPRYSLLIGKLGSRVELYDRDSDPEQKHNLIETSPEVVAELHRQFEQWAEGQATRPVVLGGSGATASETPVIKPSERTRKHLKALGYLK